MELFRLPKCRELRAALHPLIVEQYKTNYGGTVAEEEGSKRKRARGNAKSSGAGQTSREQLLKELDQQYINKTQLRAVRQMNLDKLIEEDFQHNNDPTIMNRLLTDGGEGNSAQRGMPIKRIADGAAENMSITTSTVPTAKLLTNGDGSSAQSGTDGVATSAAAFEDFELNQPLACYICRKPFTK